MGGQRPGGQKVVARSPLVRGQLAREPLHLPYRVWWKSQESESFVLRAYIVGRMWVKKFTYWLTVKDGASFPQGRPDYPNLGMCYPKSLSCSRLSLFILYAWRRQAIDQSCFMGFTVDFLPFPLPGLGMNTVARLFFPQLVEMIHTEVQGLTPSCTMIVLLAVWNAWQPYWDGLCTTGSMVETCLPLLLASCIKFFVKLQWWWPCLCFPSGHSFLGAM